MPRSGIAGSYGSSSLSFLFLFFFFSFSFFKGTSILFSTVAVSICIFTNSEQGFPFLHILANIYL